MFFAPLVTKDLVTKDLSTKNQVQQILKKKCDFIKKSISFTSKSESNLLKNHSRISNEKKIKITQVKLDFFNLR